MMREFTLIALIFPNVLGLETPLEDSHNWDDCGFVVAEVVPVELSRARPGRCDDIFAAPYAILKIKVLKINKYRFRTV